MTRKLILKVILLYSFFSVYSCYTKKIYISKGIDVYEQIELCNNGYFAHYITGNYGEDIIHGKWIEQNDTIYFKYMDDIYYIKQYDSSAKFEEFTVPQNKYLEFSVYSDKEKFKQFYILINDTIELTTDTMGYCRIDQNRLNSAVKRIKVYHNIPFYYAEFNVKKQKSNYFSIKINNPNPDSIYSSSAFLHINPRKYIIRKGRKLFDSNTNNPYNGYFKYTFRSKIKLIDCKGYKNE